MSLWTITNIIGFLLLIFETTRKWNLNKGITQAIPIDARMTISEMTGKGNGSKFFSARYEYFYEGEKYESNVDTLKLHDFRAFVEAHPVGSRLTIYVSPKNPSFSSFSQPNSFYVLARIALPYFGTILLINYFFAKAST